MAALIAIDPGDRYVGVAFFDKIEGVWECIDAQEFEPDEFAMALYDTVADPADPLRHIVYERFRLYEDKAVEQKGSEFETSQLIGKIKLIHALHVVHMAEHARAETEGFTILKCELQGQPCSLHEPHEITLTGYMADIKKPTAGILRHKKIKSVAKPIARELYKGRDHIVDAELHGRRFILKELEEEMQ